MRSFKVARGQNVKTKFKVKSLEITEYVMFFDDNLTSNDLE